MSRLYVDSNILIYLLDSIGSVQMPAAGRLAAMASARDHPVVSVLVRLECRIGPLKRRDAPAVGEFDRFFASPSLEWADLTAAVIAADHGFRVQDALHLAAAVESGCHGFLTNDADLARFSALPVELLP